MSQIALVTGASSGFGGMIAGALAPAGHTVYASTRDLSGNYAQQREEVAAHARDHGVDLRTVELDVRSQDSADAPVGLIIAGHERLDVLVHNAGHMVYGPREAVLPEQLAEFYDINVLGCQRVNRAALPLMRRGRRGLEHGAGAARVRRGLRSDRGPAPRDR